MADSSWPSLAPTEGFSDSEFEFYFNISLLNETNITTTDSPTLEPTALLTSIPTSSNTAAITNTSTISLSSEPTALPTDLPLGNARKGTNSDSQDVIIALCVILSALVFSLLGYLYYRKELRDNIKRKIRSHYKFESLIPRASPRSRNRDYTNPESRYTDHYVDNSILMNQILRPDFTILRPGLTQRDPDDEICYTRDMNHVVV
jgi:hypothetical protein